MIAKMLKFIDIGANLTDAMYKGVYNGSEKHQDDLKKVLERAWNGGVERIIVTCGSLEDINASVALTNADDRLHRTVGCHPTRCGEIEAMGEEQYFGTLKSYIEADINKKNNNSTDIKENNISNNNNNLKIVHKVVAVGECGLDYERLKFCSKEIQLKYLPPHLQLSHLYSLPLFLHCRAAHDDLIHVLSNHANLNLRGVVHSYDGSIQHANQLISMGMHIGINGCSLRTTENLEVVKQLPLDRILVESDAPWCEINNTDASFPYVKTHYASNDNWDRSSLVKGRNEPINVRQVLEVIAAVKNEELHNVAQQILDNTSKLFTFNETH